MKPDLIILSGGIGSRLASASGGVPKSLMPIGDGVFLDLLLHQIGVENFSSIYLSIGYRHRDFLNFLDERGLSGLITPVVEKNKLGTGGAIRFCIDNHPLANTFAVVNGDTLASMDMPAFIKFHSEANFDISLGVSPVSDTHRYGSVSLDGDRVIKFAEKGISGRGLIANGHSMINKTAFSERRGVFSLETEFFAQKVDAGQVNAFQATDERFIDIGVPSEYFRLRDQYLDKTGIVYKKVNSWK